MPDMQTPVAPPVHAAPLGRKTCVQPVPTPQLSIVHELASSQVELVPLHMPLAQTSLTVHTLPSSQGEVMKVCTQPTTASQLSAVQTMLSSQETGMVPTQVADWQLSPAVHGLPSSQADPGATGVKTQPMTGSHESAVHGKPSEHISGALEIQVPAEQTSLGRHALAKPHDAVLGVATHLPAEQLSSVHALPSLQSVFKTHAAPHAGMFV